LKQIVWVGILGAIGTLLRFGIDKALSPWNQNFPFSTLLVNVTGCFIAGLIFLKIQNNQINPDFGNYLLIAFCGAFTTLSAFSVQTLKLFESQQLGLALLYGVATPLLGLLAAFLPRLLH
jgi:CrcB protein